MTPPPPAERRRFTRMSTMWTAERRRRGRPAPPPKARRTSPGAAAYVEDRGSRDIHEILFVPADSVIEFDVVSAAEEHSTRSRERLMAQLRERFPNYTVRTNQPSWLRGDRRVMQACRAQVSLRE